ncbi:MAG: cold shock domain-containing protein [Bacteroidales bacterium]|nr:cold shock domain-containing protein [Bacteroidales bacterium]
MLKGKVKWFDAIKGYGYIIGEDESEIFVHFNQINKEGYKKLIKDQIVTYEIMEGEKGPQASNVSIVEE